MVRNYVRKRVQTYSNVDIGEAIKSIKDDKMTISEASAKYKVPISTLYDRLSGHNGSSPRGGTTIFSKEEESHLVYVIKRMQDYNHPVSNSNVCTIAWWYMPELKKDILDNGPARNDALPVQVLDSWLNKLYIMLKKLGLFDKPTNVFNCDESGFSDDPDKKSVVVRRETQYPIDVHAGSGKSQTTVFLTTSASDRIMKLALDNEVHTLGLPPHTTSQLQSLDVYTLKIVKTEWRKILRQYYLKTNADKVDKSVFPLLFKKLYTNALRPTYCAGGFTKAGVFRYDKRAIPREKMSYSTLSSSLNSRSNLTRALSTEYLVPVAVEDQIEEITDDRRMINNNVIGYRRLRRSPSAPTLSCTLDDKTIQSSISSASSTSLSMDASLIDQTNSSLITTTSVVSALKSSVSKTSSIIAYRSVS
ncbi:unnamed protein product [Didymodactylos carnosus]|uniref:HTH psq-type domain-containing protein n=1 Tax=Didymodactylos carnosus TaxID=1234261 RepID=A0A815AW04_9BILA|nr:unnamed protein product [Didymodactylos carnosus]